MGIFWEDEVPSVKEAKLWRPGPPKGAPFSVALPGSKKEGRTAVYRHWRGQGKLVETLDPATATTVHDGFEEAGESTSLRLPFSTCQEPTNLSSSQSVDSQRTAAWVIVLGILPPRPGVSTFGMITPSPSRGELQWARAWSSSTRTWVSPERNTALAFSARTGRNGRLLVREKHPMLRLPVIDGRRSCMHVAVALHRLYL